jgi:hypothetical protein
MWHASPSSSIVCVQTISEPVERSVQTVHLSRTDTSTVSKLVRNEISHYPRHLGVSLGACKMISEPMVCSARTVHSYRASRLALSPKGPKRVSTWASSPRSTIGCIQNDFWAYGTWAQTMHQSCTDSNVVSKRTEMRFQKTHVTYEFHRVRLKWFLSLWYVRRKPCTCLASRLALSPNGPKWAFA